MERVYRDRAVFLPEAETLVVADVHIGRDEASNLNVRVGEHEDLLERFSALLAYFDPETVVVAGDFLHSFSTVPRGITETVEELSRSCREAGTRLVVTPGNHDSMLERVWDGPTTREYRLGEWVICHGHEEPDTDAAGYIIGHDHPAIDIEGQRRPCYLFGPAAYEGAAVLVLPAFTRLAAGVEVNEMRARQFQSPLIRDVDQFRPILRDEAGDETLEFPPLGDVRSLL